MDLEAKEIQIKTDSALGSNDKVNIEFYTSQDAKIGSLEIKFADTLTYKVSGCHSSAITFLDATNYDSDKVWRVTEKADHTELYIHSNDELVVTLSYSAVANCASTYNADIAKIKFAADDTASDLYRIVGKYY